MNFIPNLQNKQIKFLIRHISSIFIFAILYYISHYYVESKGFKTLVDKEQDKKHYSFWEILYFSIGTQTSIGYGDIYPTHTTTKILTALQMLSVVIILATSIL